MKITKISKNDSKLDEILGEDKSQDPKYVYQTLTNPKYAKSFDEFSDERIEVLLDGEALLEIAPPKEEGDEGHLKYLNQWGLAKLHAYHYRGELSYSRNAETYHQFDGQIHFPVDSELKRPLLRQWCHDFSKARGWPRPERAMNASFGQAEELLKGFLRNESAFEKDRDAKEFPVVFESGTVVVSAEGMEYMPNVFRASDYIRNQIPLNFDAKAECPEFLKAIGDMFDPKARDEDVSALLLMLGIALIGQNRVGRMLILYGASKSGKSTLMKIFVNLLGITNVMGLRTEHLGERFELNSLDGKLFAIAPDCGEEFLSCPGAELLKQIVGGDHIFTEKKMGNDRSAFYGNLSVMVATNHHLKVRGNGDPHAWSSRLLQIPCFRPEGRDRISDWDKKIVAKEGSGICRAALNEVVKFLAAGEEFKLGPMQQARNDETINQSNPLSLFITNHVRATERKGAAILKDAFLEAYKIFCEEHDYSFCPQWLTPAQDELKARFSASLSGSLEKSGGGYTKGWRGVEWID